MNGITQAYDNLLLIWPSDLSAHGQTSCHHSQYEKITVIRQNKGYIERSLFNYLA